MGCLFICFLDINVYTIVSSSIVSLLFHLEYWFSEVYFVGNLMWTSILLNILQQPGCWLVTKRWGLSFHLTRDSAFQSYVVDRILWTFPFLPYRDPNTFWEWYWNWNLNTVRFVSVIRQPNHIIWEYDDWCLHLGHTWFLRWYIDTHQLLPRSLTWNLKISPWKKKIPIGNPSFSGSMLNFGGFMHWFFEVIRWCRFDKYTSRGLRLKNCFNTEGLGGYTWSTLYSWRWYGLSGSC